ncbi:hypothetical protein BJF78_19635 [Pseudonocardia sp. CNS-139]|nr:hypothetical protein BJF78_19635 [Pseudonocardia sp. CNS-139]
MTLREYLQLLRRGRWWISGGLVLGVLAGIAITWNTAPTYTATTTLYLAAIEGGGEPGQAYQGSLLAEQKAASYAELLSSARMHDDVSNSIGEQVPPGSITALASAGSPVLTIEARASSPELAVRIAEATAEDGANLVSDLERPLDPLLSTVLTLRLVRPAELPTAPTSPDAANNVALGAVLGALAGLAVALVRRSLDRSIRSREALEAVTGRPALAAVPQVRRTRRARAPMMSADPDGAFAESFRRLRSNLAFRIGDDYRSVLVTSPATGEGKSTVACNLATALGLEGRRVLLVDADLRGSGAGACLGIRSDHGLAAVLTQRRTPSRSSSAGWTGSSTSSRAGRSRRTRASCSARTPCASCSSTSSTATTWS